MEKHPVKDHSKQGRLEKKKPKISAKKSSAAVQCEFDLESFEPRLMMDANAALDQSGNLTLTLTSGADSFLVSHVSTNPDGSEVVSVKNVTTSVTETYGTQVTNADGFLVGGVTTIDASG